MIKIFLALGMVFIATPAFSQVQLLNPIYGGKACPAGTASVVSAEGQIQILFDYAVESSPDIRTQSSCAIRIPARVDSGFQIRQRIKQTKAFASVPAGRKIYLEVIQSMSSGQKQKGQKNFIGPVAQNFDLNNDLLIVDPPWSSCGRTQIILMTELKSESIATSKDAINRLSLLAIDQMEIQVEVRRCH